MKNRQSKPLLRIMRILISVALVLLVLIYAKYIFEQITKWLGNPEPMIVGLLVSSGGIIAGVLANLLTDWFLRKVDISSLLERINDRISILSENLINFTGRLQKNIEKVMESYGNVAQLLFNALISLTVNTEKGIVFLLEGIIKLNKIPSVLIERSKAPKWYHEKDAIDPGLVEVSLALTAILIAVPSFIKTNTPLDQILLTEGVRFGVEAISMFTSISLLNRYAKNKGAKHNILLSPIESGPFFFLSWAITLGFIFLAIITFEVV